MLQRNLERLGHRVAARDRAADARGDDADLVERDAAGIAAFRARGGGVLTTRDHQDLGACLLPRRPAQRQRLVAELPLRVPTATASRRGVGAQRGRVAGLTARNAKDLASWRWPGQPPGARAASSAFDPAPQRVTHWTMVVIGTSTRCTRAAGMM